MSDGAARTTSAPGVRWCSRCCRTCRSTPTGAGSTPPRTSTPGSGRRTARRWTRGSTPGRGGRAATCCTRWRPALHDHAIDDALGDLTRARHCVGVMGGHELGRDTDGYAGVGRSSAATLARRRSDGRHRRRPRRDGGRQPRRLPGRRTTTACSTRRWACSPPRRPSGRRSASWATAAFDVRERWPSEVDSLGIPTWFYGHEPPNAFASADREVLRERDPRGRAAALLRGRHRVPARPRRHRAGGLPGRLRELLRRRLDGRPDGAGRPRLLDPRAARVAAAVRARARTGRWPARCTSSTTSPRSRPSSPPPPDRRPVTSGAVLPACRPRSDGSTRRRCALQDGHMPEPVRVIRAAELAAADPTPGMSRELAFEVPLLWSGRVVTEPGAVSGWHHHDRNETSLYVVSGVLRLEFEGGQELGRRRPRRLRARPGVHRAPREQPDRRALGGGDRPGRRRRCRPSTSTPDRRPVTSGAVLPACRPGCDGSAPAVADER